MITFLSSDLGGAGRWRSFWPAEALRTRGHEAYVVLDPAEVDCSKGDVLISHRPLDFDVEAVLLEMKRRGTTVLVDEDDDIHHHPEDFDWAFRKKIEGKLPIHRSLIEQADGLVTTTDRLVEVYGPWTKRTWVMPNLISGRVGQHGWEPRVSRNGPRVGWAGITRTHLHDLRWLAPAAEEMLKGAVFTWLGYMPGEPTAAELLKLTPAQPSAMYFVTNDVASFYREMSNCHVGIVPLKPDEPLNWAKSNIKALEYMTLGKPVVATKLPEQEKLVEHGVTGFLASTPAEFAEHVQTLVHDPELRRAMGQAGREQAREWTIEARGGQWVDLVSSISALSRTARTSRRRRAAKPTAGETNGHTTASEGRRQNAATARAGA